MRSKNKDEVASRSGSAEFGRRNSVKLEMDGFRGVRMDLTSLGKSRAVQRQAMYVKRLLNENNTTKA